MAQLTLFWGPFPRLLRHIILCMFFACAFALRDALLSLGELTSWQKKPFEAEMLGQSSAAVCNTASTSVCVCLRVLL